ncbi:Glycine--tRNA ligase beta subunit [Pelomyxa schiedti]|nr:Glycine--tRNA ligase beta subunit [Pelomyxa schiedti]
MLLLLLRRRRGMRGLRSLEVRVISPRDWSCNIMGTGTGTRKQGLMGRSELMLFFVETLASLSPSSALKKSSIFELLVSSRSELAQQFLCLVMEHSPSKVAQAAFLSEADMFKNFFCFHDDRITQWFCHFSFTGQPKFGAMALEHYLFSHRETLWDQLQWSGKRHNPPGLAAHKRHLMMELDVHKAINNVLSRDLHFWESEQFKECIASGDFLCIDYIFFADLLRDKIKLYQHSSDPTCQAVVSVIGDYIDTVPLSSMLDNLIHLLSPSEMLFLMRTWSKNLELEPTIGHLVLHVDWDSPLPSAPSHSGSKTVVGFESALCCNTLLTHPTDVARALFGEDQVTPEPVIRQMADYLRSKHPIFSNAQIGFPVPHKPLPSILTSPSKLDALPQCSPSMAVTHLQDTPLMQLVRQWHTTDFAIIASFHPHLKHVESKAKPWASFDSEVLWFVGVESFLWGMFVKGICQSVEAAEQLMQCCGIHFERSDCIPVHKDEAFQIPANTGGSSLSAAAEQVKRRRIDTGHSDKKLHHNHKHKHKKKHKHRHKHSSDSVIIIGDSSSNNSSSDDEIPEPRAESDDEEEALPPTPGWRISLTTPPTSASSSTSPSSTTPTSAEQQTAATASQSPSTTTADNGLIYTIPELPQFLYKKYLGDLISLTTSRLKP